ncbi:TPA: hypothetical protein ACPWNK_006633, partial [Pseudomonas aeruginosa]
GRNRPEADISTERLQSYSFAVDTIDESMNRSVMKMAQVPELSRRASHRSRGGPWSTGCWPKFMARMVLDLVGRIGHGVAI